VLLATIQQRWIHADLLVFFGNFFSFNFSTPAHLAYSLQDAKANNYSLGVKLVRGAYHPHEMAAHPSFSATTTADTSPNSRLPSISPDPYPPVWLEKQDTDKCYNACARLLISEIKADVERQVKSGGPARIGVLFGTHNWESCNIILKELVDRGLAVEDKDEGETIIRIGTDVTDRLIFGQLYGELSGDIRSSWEN
jgi:proline dehydrogenase